MPRPESALKPLLACALFGIATIAGFWVPLSHPSSTSGFDWDLFAGYSLVIRSIILVYHRLPLHDPWVLGGLDLLANPQTRVFSPMVLVDLLFGPHTANLASLMIYSFAGLAGMFLLLRDRGVSPWTSMACSLLFIQSSWFGLHFVEGHIAYGSIQLLPWVLYFGLHWERPRFFFGLASVMALHVLDGGIYAAFYSIMLLAAGAAVGLIKPAGLLARAGLNALIAGSALLLISTKVVPVVLLTARIKPTLEFVSLGWGDLARIFFNPFQRFTDILNIDTLYRFHEFGCYLSPIALLVVLWQWRSLAKSAVNRQLFALLLLFFWIGSGWGGIFNPWHLQQRIPLLNMAHVQSRLFVVMDLLFALLVAGALDRIRSTRRTLWIALCSFLAVEAAFVKTYPFYAAYRFAKPVPGATLISKTSIRTMKEWGTKPELYLAGDTAYTKSYERAALPTGARSDNKPGYRGLVYPQSGQGEISLESFTPGRIELDYRGPLSAEFNSNFLGGWVVSQGRVRATESGLIGIDLDAGSGKVELDYRPTYLPYVLTAYIAGLLLWLALLVHLARRP